ncbi:MAG: hypothetical protein NTW38_00845 [Candidatus Aminicenantes bacterium]|nr:hypothetical protein [Candidatus Aminicenantes bacterium]
MAIRRCPYCKAIIDESQKYCNNCGTQLLFPDDDQGEEPIKGEKIVDEDFPDKGEERESEEIVDELRDEADIEAEDGEEREEIDLEKVMEGKAEIGGKAADEDLSLVDLREAEPGESAPESVPEEPSIEKPATLGEISSPEISLPGQFEPDKIEVSKPVRPSSRQKKQIAADESVDEIIKPPETGEKDESARKSPGKSRRGWEFEVKPLSPPAVDFSKLSPGRKDHDTKFEIARLIADFEQRRRNYTAELGAEAADAQASDREESGNEPFEPPAEAEAGQPPTSEEIEKEADALRTESTGDFATEYEFNVDQGASAAEEPASTEDRLPFLVGNFKKAVQGGQVSDEDREIGDQHPVFATGDFEEETGAKDLAEKDRIIREKRRDFVAEEHKGEIETKEPPAVESNVMEEKSALIARILKKKSEASGRPGDERAASETWEALKPSKIAEPAFPSEPEEIEEPKKAEEELASREERSESPVGDTMDFQNEVLRKSSEEFPPIPTMGIPETVAQVPAPLPFDIPAGEVEVKKEREAIAPPEKPVVRRPEPVAEEKAADRELVREAREKIEEAVESEEIRAERPSVRAPVVRLGFFRRIKATIFDLLVVGVFWAGATALAAHFLSVPILDLVIVAAVPLGILFAVLLTVYLFMFLLFLGETPGGRLAMPKN